jgi:hypothetical protein
LPAFYWSSESAIAVIGDGAKENIRMFDLLAAKRISTFIDAVAAMPNAVKTGVFQMKMAMLHPVTRSHLFYKRT